MILLKFIGWVFIFLFAVAIFMRIFGRPIMRYLMKVLVKRAQADMEQQARNYEQYVNGNPFEDNVYVDEDVKVSVKRGDPEPEQKASIDPNMIETVEFEDIE